MPQFAKVYVGQFGEVRQYRLEIADGQIHNGGDNYRFSSEKPRQYKHSGAAFSDVIADPCKIKNAIGDTGFNFVKNMTRGGKLREKVPIERMLIVSAWQVNLIVPASRDNNDVDRVVLTAIARTLHKTVQSWPETRPIGSIIPV